MQASFDPDGPGAADAGIYGLPHSADEAEVVLIPVPWDATTSYRAGAAQGPDAILGASVQVDLDDLEVGRAYERGIHMLPIPEAWRLRNAEARALAEPIIARGGAAGDRNLEGAQATVNTMGAELNRHVQREVEHWLARGKLVGIVGGDHASPFGAIEALAARHPGMGVLHFDAHADLRDAYEGFTWSHASIMHNVLERVPSVAKLVQVGIRDVGASERARMAGDVRIRAFSAVELAERRFGGETWRATADAIVAALPQDVYISFDIDGLDPTLCPHTGTPVPGGLAYLEACFLLRRVAESGRRIVGFDLCEVAPGPDGDEWDGNVGARLLYKLIGWSLRHR